MRNASIRSRSANPPPESRLQIPHWMAGRIHFDVNREGASPNLVTSNAFGLENANLCPGGRLPGEEVLIIDPTPTQIP